MDKMGEELNQLVSVEKLSLATNLIERMISLGKLRHLRILSLGRNKIRRLAFLEEISGSLEELWISYNLIEKLDGLEKCSKLNTLFIASNKIHQWDETNKLACLPQLKSILMTGNPIALHCQKEDFIPHLVRRVPQLDTVNGK
jgi:dynein light chain 1